MADAAAKAKVERDEAAAMKDRATADKTKLDGLLDLIMAGAAIPLPTSLPSAAPGGPMLEGRNTRLSRHRVAACRNCHSFRSYAADPRRWPHQVHPLAFRRM